MSDRPLIDIMAVHQDRQRRSTTDRADSHGDEDGSGT
jgi:hypothetical protein